MDPSPSQPKIVIPEEEEWSNGDEFLSALDFTVPLSPMSPESTPPHELNVTYTLETPVISKVLPVISPSGNAPFLKSACVVAVVNKPKMLGSGEKNAAKIGKVKSHIPTLTPQEHPKSQAPGMNCEGDAIY